MAKKPKYFTISDEQADKLRSKRTVTAPKSYDPGKGRPKEYLSYLNKGEMKALRSMNGGNMERGPKGLPSFADDSASSKGVSRGGQGAVGSNSGGGGSKSTGSSGSKNQGPGGGMMGGSGSGGPSRTSPSSGGGGGGGGGGSGGDRRGGGGGGGPGGGMMGGSGSGGPSRTSPSSGGGGGGGGKGGGGGGRDLGVAGVPGGVNRQGGPQAPSRASSPSGGAGGAGRPKGDLGVAGVPGGVSRMGGPQAPRSLSAPAGNQFGPRVGVDRTADTVTPSSIAAQNTLDRIAAGSSIAGGYTGKMQDQVPRDLTYKSIPSQEVKTYQAPTVGPNRGLGESLPNQSEDIFAGANSPFADPGVTQYNRETYNQNTISPMVDKNGKYYSRTTSPTVAQDERVMDAYRASLAPDGIPTPTGRAFAVTQQAVPATSFSQPSYLDSGTRYPAVSTSRYAEPAVGAPALGTRTGLAGVNYGSLNTPEENAMSRTVAAGWQSQAPQKQIASPSRLPTTTTSYGPTVASVADPYNQRYAKATSSLNNAPIVRTPQVATPVNVSVPRYGFTNPYAGGVANVTPVNTAETSAERTVREAPTQEVGPSNPVGKYIADKVADKFNTRVAPSQQDNWMDRVDNAIQNQFGTPSADSAYARMMRNAERGGGGGSREGGGGYGGTTGTGNVYQPVIPPSSPTAPAPVLLPLPAYVNYQQLPTNYGTGYTGGVAPSPLVSQYLANGYADGGAVGGGGDGWSLADRLKFAFENGPRGDGGIGSLVQPVLWAVGAPDSLIPGKSLNTYFYEQAISRGQNPYEVLPWLSGAGPSKKAAAPAPKPEEPYKPVQQVSQYELPPPSSPIAAFNQGQGAYSVLDQQNQMFRLPEKRGGGVGDGIDAAIRLAKSFA